MERETTAMAWDPGLMRIGDTMDGCLSRELNEYDGIGARQSLAYQ